MRVISTLAGTAMLLVGVAAPLAHADDAVVVLDQVVQGPPGSVVLLASDAVDPSLVGRSCTATYTGTNNGSVHPGTDLLLASGAAQIVLEGVEDTQGKVTTATSQLFLGDRLDVSVRLGSDGQSSLGAAVSLTCAPPATTTTTTTTTSPSTSTAPAPTTGAPTTLEPTTVAPTSVTPTSAVDAAGVTTSTIVGSGGPVSSTTTTVRPVVAPAGTSLPATGSDAEQLATIALAAVLAGAVLCLSRRRAAPDATR